MKFLIIDVKTKSNPIRAHVSVDRNEMDGYFATDVCFPSNPLKSVSFTELCTLIASINQQLNELNTYRVPEVTNEPTVGHPNGLPAKKMGLMNALAHVFKGGDGPKGMLSRLDDIRKLAESEMNEEEKKAASGLMENLKTLGGKK